MFGLEVQSPFVMLLTITSNKETSKRSFISQTVLVQNHATAVAKG